MKSTEFGIRMYSIATRLQQETYHKKKIMMHNRNTNEEVAVEYGPKWFTILEGDSGLVNVGDILFNQRRGRFVITEIHEPDYGLVTFKIRFLSIMEPHRFISDLAAS